MMMMMMMIVRAEFCECFF